MTHNGTLRGTNSLAAQQMSVLWPMKKTHPKLTWASLLRVLEMACSKSDSAKKLKRTRGWLTDQKDWVIATKWTPSNSISSLKKSIGEESAVLTNSQPTVLVTRRSKVLAETVESRAALLGQSTKWARGQAKKPTISRETLLHHVIQQEPQLPACLRTSFPVSQIRAQKAFRSDKGNAIQSRPR